MKLSNKNYWAIILTIFFLGGCIPPSAIEKKDIKNTAVETREEILELQNVDPMDPSDLSLIDSDARKTERNILTEQKKDCSTSYIKPNNYQGDIAKQNTTKYAIFSEVNKHLNLPINPNDEIN